jgi:hypothetical protein
MLGLHELNKFLFVNKSIRPYLFLYINCSSYSLFSESIIILSFSSELLQNLLIFFKVFFKFIRGDQQIILLLRILSREFKMDI